MSKKVTTHGQSAMRAEAGFYPAGPAILAPAAQIPFSPQPSPAEAIDGSDRAFFLWVLVGLIAATVVAGAIAMSGVVTIIPSS